MFAKYFIYGLRSQAGKWTNSEISQRVIVKVRVNSSDSKETKICLGRRPKISHA